MAALGLVILVANVVSLQSLGEPLGAVGHSAVVLANADPEKLHLLVGLVGVGKERCIPLHEIGVHSGIDAGLQSHAEYADPSELVEVGRRRPQRLRSTHGKTRDGAVLARGENRRVSTAGTQRRRDYAERFSSP